MTSWLIALRDRPIAEQERRGALTATTAVLITTAILLALTHPAPHHHTTTPHTTTANSTTQVTHTSTPATSASFTSALSPGAVVVSRAFLSGYLAYTYGHAPASKITNATPGLIASLKAHPPRVSPGMRHDHPHVIALHPTIAPSGLLGVSVVINDGGLIDYTIALHITPHDKRLLVSALEEN